MRTSDYEGLQTCDKAIFFSIITCFLIYLRYDCEVFLNFCIGFGMGGCIWYWGVIWMMSRKAKRLAKEAWGEAQISQKKFDEAFEEKFGRKPESSGWIRK